MADFPELLVLSSLQVTAPVLAVKSSKGILQVPDDPANVGWWVGSALPGSATGTTVIDGHIDSATDGVGALWHLSSLVIGDVVSLQLRNGSTIRYNVVARRVYPKDAGLPQSIFTLSGPPTLVLISCGGPFDTTIKSYEDNIAVFASPTE